MLNKEIMIILPKKISILRNKKNQGIVTDKEEYSIYYQNIIYPYSTEYDVQIKCEYGQNLGHCWRIDSFDNVAKVFDFSLQIYDDYGKLLACKNCKIEIFEKKSHEDINLLCIGDSMTRSEIYIRQAVNKARNIKTVGLRNISNNVNHEGRGGWTSYAFFESAADIGKGISPFLFPIGYEGEKYFGCKVFWEKINSGEFSDDYNYAGITKQQIEEGMLCYDDNKLYRYVNGTYVEEQENPRFEFSFKKYLERYKIASPNIVSLLFGANEFPESYEYIETEAKRFIDTLKKMVSSIKEYDEKIKIIVNLPICGADQYAWGMQMGCGGGGKMYDYWIKTVSAAILKAFDCRRSENIYVCPMIAVCDPVAGFPWAYTKINVYSERTQICHTNWIHPSEIGYKQMGDALAGVLADIRDK